MAVHTWYKERMDTKVGNRIQNKSTRQTGRVLEVDEAKGTYLVELTDKDQVYWEIKDTKQRRLIIEEVA